jgi:hypothetical protein
MRVVRYTTTHKRYISPTSKFFYFQKGMTKTPIPMYN